MQRHGQNNALAMHDMCTSVLTSTSDLTPCTVFALLPSTEPLAYFELLLDLNAHDINPGCRLADSLSWPNSFFNARRFLVTCKPIRKLRRGSLAGRQAYICLQHHWTVCEPSTAVSLREHYPNEKSTNETETLKVCTCARTLWQVLIFRSPTLHPWQHPHQGP